MGIVKIMLNDLNAPEHSLRIERATLNLAVRPHLEMVFVVKMEVVQILHQNNNARQSVEIGWKE
jgi:hypothetical protein